MLVAALVLFAPPPDYLRDVKPLLKDRCFACHGSLAQQGGLRLDGRANLLAAVVVPGKPDESKLLEKVSEADESQRMPPEGQPLKPGEIAAIRAWIAAGAVMPKDDAAEPDPRQHWAFTPPKRGGVPGAGNPIDAFVAAEWTKRGLTPVGPADKRRLLRRVTIDLTGLPPTPGEIDAFLADDASDAYEKVVEKLLASLWYAERWGRHFLDIWRYSDWWGLGAEVRNSQKHVYHWRDWVIESVAADRSYADLLRLMLAADEIAPTNLPDQRATGYLARQYFKFNRNSWLDETVEHTAKGFLGLTWNCARCHDHKYDPIAHADYYRLRAVFEPYQVRTDVLPGEPNLEADGVPRAFDCDLDRPTHLFVRGDEKQPDTKKQLEPGVPTFLSAKPLAIRPVTLPPESFAPQLRPHVRDIYLAAAKKEGELAVKAVEARWEADRLAATGDSDDAKRATRVAAAAEAAAKHAAAEAKRDAVTKELAAAKGVKRIAPGIRLIAATKAVATAKAKLASPGDAYTSLRGAEKMVESNLESEAVRARPFPRTSTGRRAAFADWVADRGNPLTARVAVNHVWLRHFGRPLVPTVFDFGRRGQHPSHPALLDWLAVEFMDRGWSLKHLHRLMVTSRVYRLSSSSAGADAKTLAADPENLTLWRMNPVRMDAPTVRDGLLHLASDLDEKRGGQPVPPAEFERSRRRSVYFFQSHNDHSKFLELFDDANVLDCYRRQVSVVPQQALALANSKFAMASADKIASRLGDRPDAAFVAAAFELLLGTSPTADESVACVAAMAEFRKLAGTDADRRARVGIVRALVNHNDFVTIR